MRKRELVAQIGVDTHRTFSQVSARDAKGKMVWRQRRDHTDRQRVQEPLRGWPDGVPVVLEATFGWGWLRDELAAAGLKPHLATSRKVAA